MLANAKGLLRLAHLEKTSHQLPIQAPPRGVTHMMGQVDGQHIVHSWMKNRLQLDVPRNHPLVQEHGFAVQRLRANTSLVDVGYSRSVVGHYPDHLTEQSFPQTAKHQMNRSELQPIDVEQRLLPLPMPVKEGGM